jgi:NAD(P)-dependent dehydrogenase (short-subunit alcohol dehydrogenase family)
VVTGGANGIGFQISRQFAQAKAKVIMVNRKEDQGDEAIKQIKEETPGADVDWVGCDLGNLKEVKQVFTDLRNKLDRVDLVSARQEVDNRIPRRVSPRLTGLVHS